MYKNILSIGGFFSRTGEGLNRDLHALTETGNRGRPIITAISPSGEQSPNHKTTHFIPTDVIIKQIEQSFISWPIKGIKTGYMGDATMAEAICACLSHLKKEHDIPLIVDPSIISSNGERYIDKAGLNILKRDLVLIADLITPSVKEAELLTGMEIQDIDDMHKAADMLLTLGSKAVFIRGGNFAQNELIDLLATDSAHITFKQPRLMIAGISGALGYGGVIACVITAMLAEKASYKKAIEAALDHVKGTFLADL